ncbi:C-type mannose receptor 2-like [Phlebotomus argentipes]|uniref:C-type mannose receptor 2-like n=1 Tax=Phlebotomus argentipes TaxID=94469 RepID=UPI002892D08E|nr:C-type mannose receptor 2-like [Phlebotomus argentipes]
MKLDWFDAKSKCKDFGYNILAIKSKDENAAIQNILKNHSEDFAIGGFGFEVDGIWRWDGDREPLTYVNWISGEPVANSLKYCAYIRSNDGLWKTSDCDNETLFICQQISSEQ